MKRVISTVGAAALLAGALLAPALLRAEDKAEKPAQEEGHHGGMRAKFKEKLGLTDEQESKLKALRRAHREASESAKNDLQAAMRKLGDQLEDKASEKDLSATLDKIKAGRRALRDAQDKFEADAAAVLTPTQRAKMVVAMGRMMKGGMRGHGGPGMRGHGGWGEHEGGGGPERGPKHDDDEMDD